jgi:hypothetical protein
MACFLMAAMAGFLVLAHFPPDQHVFYPRCSLFSSTGILCPGCGSLRALHALTQGDWAGAIQSNLLLTLGLPLMALLWLGGRLARRAGLEAVWHAGRLAWLGLAMVLAFGLLRNLPGPLGQCLAP